MIRRCEVALRREANLKGCLPEVRDLLAEALDLLSGELYTPSVLIHHFFVYFIYL